MTQLIQSAPNLSVGRRPEVLQAASSALGAVPGLRVLDMQADREQNRSVFTLAGDAGALTAAILALCDVATARVDLRTQQGAHPRVGALDVVPFIPVEGADMTECVRLAREVGQQIAERFGIPVYLYEEAATAPHRRSLEDVRQGQFEGLAERMRDPLWKPDFGPAVPHPSAGAAVVGARMPLIAYAITLGTSDLEVARRVARAIRFSDGGFRYVKAAGVEGGEAGAVQVSINMTDYTKTPLHRVFEAVKAEAARYGVAVTGSELLGLFPAEALYDAAAHFLRLEAFDPSQILERRLRESGDRRPASRAE